MGALSVALMGLLGTLVFVDLGALVQAATHATNGALARNRGSGQGAVTATVAGHAQAGTVVAVAMVRAIVQAGAGVAVIAGPPRGAEAGAVVAFAMAGAFHSSHTRAARCAVITSIPTVAVALTLPAITHAIARAVIWARTLGAIQVSPALVALAGHVHTSALVVACVHAGGGSAVHSSPARAAVAGAIVAVAMARAVCVASLQGAIIASVASKTLAGEVDTLSHPRAIGRTGSL